MEGGSVPDSGAGAAWGEDWETLEARLVASEEAEEVVASRRYSTTSQVCRVASGAKETRRLAVAKSVRGLESATTILTERFTTCFFSLLLVLVVGREDRFDCGDKGRLRARSALKRSIHFADMRTLRRFPLLSFRTGSSSAPRPPGPMLLLRVFLAGFGGFFGEGAGAAKDAPANRPSAMFSLPWSLAMVGCVRLRAGRVVVLKRSWLAWDAEA